MMRNTKIIDRTPIMRYNKGEDILDNELKHHGILGMKWGKRNGPPYPLGQGDKSTAEKRAEKSEDSQRHGLTKGQKTALKIGAAAIGTALAAYGTYRLVKSGKLDGLISDGKATVDKLLGNNKAGDTDFGKNKVESILGLNSAKSGNSITKKLAKPESLADTLSKANQLNGTGEGRNNCTYSSIAGFLRQKGYDVTAKGTPNQTMQNLGGIVEKCFKGATVLDGTATKFGRSRKDAAEMLVKKFGDNASGVCCVQWKDSDGGHAFNWSIKDGVVRFFDSQKGRDDWQVSRYFDGMIDTNNLLTIARLDNAEINFDALKDIIK